MSYYLFSPRIYTDSQCGSLLDDSAIENHAKLKNISTSKHVLIYLLGIMKYLILKIEFLHSSRTKGKLRTNHSGESLCDF